MAGDDRLIRSVEELSKQIAIDGRGDRREHGERDQDIKEEEAAKQGLDLPAVCELVEVLDQAAVLGAFLVHEPLREEAGRLAR